MVFLTKMLKQKVMRLLAIQRPVMKNWIAYWIMPLHKAVRNKWRHQHLWQELVVQRLLMQLQRLLSRLSQLEVLPQILQGLLNQAIQDMAFQAMVLPFNAAWAVYHTTKLQLMMSITRLGYLEMVFLKKYWILPVNVVISLVTSTFWNVSISLREMAITISSNPMEPTSLV